MLIRDALPAGLDDVNDPIAAPTRWQGVAHDMIASVQGLSRNGSRVNLASIDKRLGLALAALVAVMFYVACMASLTSFALTHLADGFDDNIRASMTVEILPLSDNADNSDAKSMDQRAKDAQEKLQTVSGIAKVQTIPAATLAGLLRPWLGDDTKTENLPFPRLLDITLDKSKPLDRANLDKTLAAMQGVTLDDHGLWLQELAHFGESLKRMALYVVGLALLALALCAYCAAQASFYIHRDTIEIMHLIGAEDDTIADDTGRSILRLALMAGMAAFAVGLVTLSLLWMNSQGLKLSFFSGMDVGVMDWAGLVLLWAITICGGIFLSLLISRLTVLRALRKLL